MKKIITSVLLTLTVLIANAQNDTGVQFEQRLNWQQILAKAKNEHKFIFVDCYATWCGPCKYMDQTVYTNKEVGDTYNKDFVSLRLQMDKTDHDNQTVRSWYRIVKKLESDYTINAYPTFLFFDPDGNPVHKVIGALDIKGFMGLAADAKDSDKQYYRLLKNFQPGKVDTTDERGLAFSLINTDKVLAGKLAADYLSRIPKTDFKDHQNGQLMVTFRNDPTVMAVTEDYVRSMSRAKLIHNAVFLIFLKDNPVIKATALKAIAHLPNTAPDSKETVLFIDLFTQRTTDKGFRIFWEYSKAIDTLMKSQFYAQEVIKRSIIQTYFETVNDSAKHNGSEPDFERIQRRITEKYGSWYGEACAADQKSDYYGFLVRKKQQPGYWPQLLKAEATKIELFWVPDPKRSPIPLFWINNTLYSDFFFHADDPVLLEKAVSWLKIISSQVSGTEYYNDLDTYACVLYKSEQLTSKSVGDAIKLEEDVLQDAIKRNSKKEIEQFTATLDVMKQNGPIWKIKERLADEQ